LLGERLSPSMFFGGALIVGAVVLVVIRPARPAEQPQSRQ
jgi:drug/metabolite transporter (DMT)-like permease